MDIDVKVDGLEHIRDVMTRKLPEKSQRKVILKALRVASKPMLKTAKATVAKESGALALSLSAWNDNKRKKDTVGTVHIGPKRGNKKAIAVLGAHYGRSFNLSKIGIYHGHIVEFGTKTQTAKPYLGPAMAAHGQSMIKGFGAIMGKEIEKEALRLKGKQRK